MGAGFTAPEEDLYFRTVEAVRRRLRQTPADPLTALRHAGEAWARAEAKAPAPARAAVVCRSGCSLCCHERVGVQAHEVLLAAEFIRARLAPGDLAGIIARAAAHRTAFADRGQPGWVAPRTPCVLLRDGACSIYPARPEACRAHHSHSLEGCRINLEHGYEAVAVHIPGLRGRMFAVMLGIDQAVEEAGYDDAAYDFGSALHEALTNDSGAIRWLRRQQAFPDSCRE